MSRHPFAKERARLWLMVGALVSCACLLAQDIRFEVVSIKRNTSGQGVGGGVLPGGRYTANQLNVFSLIYGAFRNDRILNLPAWAEDERYDIVAKAETDIAPGQLPLLIHSLLVDRFKFKGHREIRSVPVYRLVVARPDGTLGPRLRPTKTDCNSPDPSGQAGASARGCGGGARNGILSFVGLNTNSLAKALEAPTGRPVVNETSLSGRYDIDLEWTTSPDVLDGVSVYTAVQEQLGLKLIPSNADVEVIVVEHVERPTEN